MILLNYVNILTFKYYNIMKSNTFSKTDFENKLMALENILTSNKDLDIDILPLKKKSMM